MYITQDIFNTCVHSLISIISDEMINYNSTFFPVDRQEVVMVSSRMTCVFNLLLKNLAPQASTIEPFSYSILKELHKTQDRNFLFSERDKMRLLFTFATALLLLLQVTHIRGERLIQNCQLPGRMPK